jgi:hypothetical protein
MKLQWNFLKCTKKRMDFSKLVDALHQGGGKPLHVKTTMHGVYVIPHVVILLICESF